MKQLLLLCALLIPAVGSAQSWQFKENVAVPYTTAPGSGIHGVAIDNQGRLWTQNYYGSEPLVRNGADLTTRALYVLNADGTQAPCSPIIFIKDSQGAVVDTLGYFTNATGAAAGRTGRGITSDADGNILVSQEDILYQLDAASCNTSNIQSIEQIARAQPFPGTALTSAAADAEGNIYVAAVVGGGQPILQFGSGLVPKQNVAAKGYGIGRDLFASADGLTVIDHAFNKRGAVLHHRSNTFTPFDSVGVTLRGLATESSGVQPNTGYFWFSSGPAGTEQPNQDSVATYYQPFSWYAFAAEDLLVMEGGVVTGTVEFPTPRDSIVVEAWTGAAGPRGIAFSADGMTAYVANFNSAPAEEIKVFTKMGVASEGSPDAQGFALSQNRPNPFMDRTEIAFTLDAPGHVRLNVYDVTGRTVASLVDESRTAGPYKEAFDARGLAAGMYIYTLEVDGQAIARRMAVVR